MLVGRWPLSVHWTIHPLTQDLSTSMFQAHSHQPQPGLTSVTYHSTIIHLSTQLSKPFPQPPWPLQSGMITLDHLRWDHWDR